MEGKELWQIMDRKLDLAEVLRRKQRRTDQMGKLSSSCAYFTRFDTNTSGPTP
jgi:hypothetical protein